MKYWVTLLFTLTLISCDGLFESPVVEEDRIYDSSYRPTIQLTRVIDYSPLILGKDSVKVFEYLQGLFINKGIRVIPEKMLLDTLNLNVDNIYFNDDHPYQFKYTSDTLYYHLQQVETVVTKSSDLYVYGIDNGISRFDFYPILSKKLEEINFVDTIVRGSQLDLTNVNFSNNIYVSLFSIKDSLDNIIKVPDELGEIRLYSNSNIVDWFSQYSNQTITVRLSVSSDNQGYIDGTYNVDSSIKRIYYLTIPRQVI